MKKNFGFWRIFNVDESIMRRYKKIQYIMWMSQGGYELALKYNIKITIIFKNKKLFVISFVNPVSSQ